MFFFTLLKLIELPEAFLDYKIPTVIGDDVKVAERKQHSPITTRRELQELLQKAKNILDKNWNGNFTVPSPVLYPHQWSWDSAFVAIGNSYINIERAIKELEYLFDTQWKNGMVPQIAYGKQ